MDGVMQLLWMISWQAAVLAAVVWVVTRLARRSPASWRHALWVIVLVKLFVPPFAVVPAEWAFWVVPSGEQRVESRGQRVESGGRSFRACEESAFSASSESQKQIPPFGRNDIPNRQPSTVNRHSQPSTVNQSHPRTITWLRPSGRSSGPPHVTLHRTRELMRWAAGVGGA